MSIKEINERLALVGTLLEETPRNKQKRVTNALKILRELRIVSDELIYEYDRLHGRDKEKSLRHRCLSEALRYEEEKEQAPSSSDDSATP